MRGKRFPLVQSQALCFAADWYLLTPDPPPRPAPTTGTESKAGSPAATTGTEGKAGSPATTARTATGTEDGEDDLIDDVLFDFDRSTVKPEAARILDRLVVFMNENKDKRAALAGYTDNVGNEAYNQALSERRVASVRDYVVKKGVESSRISGQGFGESKPIADNKTADGRAKNRRVEIKVN